MKNLTRVILVLVLLIPRTILAQDQDSVTFFIDTILIDINDPLEVPVSVDNFDEVSGFQLSLNWNTSELTFDSLSEFNMPGLNLANFNTSLTGQGQLSVIWFEPTISNISLPDSTAIFKIFFQAFETCDSTAQVVFSDDPTDRIVVKVEGLDPIELPAKYVDGTVISQCPVLEAAGTANGGANGASGCVALEVNFQDASNYESDNVSWQWFSGDGESSTDTNTVFTYDTPGSYTAMLVLSDPFSTDTATFDIEVFDLPDISIDVQQDGCNPQAVMFVTSNNGNVAITSYQWDFGDNTSSNLASPLHLFANIDTQYDVTLEVEDANSCTNTYEETIFVPDYEPLSLSILLLESPGCDTAIGSIALAPSGGTAPYFYGWSHDAGLTDSVGVNLAAGDYDITLTDSEDCTVEFTYTLEEFGEYPLVALGPDTSYCNGQTLVLNAGNDGVTFAWSLDGQVLSGQTASTLTVMASGTYEVQVTNELNCSTFDTVSVAALPSPTVTLADDATICATESFMLDAQNPGASFAWFLNGMVLAGEQNSSLNATEAGAYVVEVTNSDNCIATDTFNLTVDMAPMPNLGQDQMLCEGNMGMLSANASGTIAWFLDGMLLDGETGEQLSVSTAGEYVVEISNANNCIGRDTVEVSFAPLPEVDLGSDDAFCDGSSFTIDAGNPGASFSWALDGSILAGENQSQLLASTAGSYSVTVTAGDNCAASDTIQLALNELPTIDAGSDELICDGEMVQFSANSNGQTFQWFLDGTTISGATDPLLDASASGLYVIEATSAENCLNADTVMLSVNPLPQVALGQDTFFCGAFEYLLDAGNAGASFQWFLDGDPINGATASTLTATSSGNYSVEVTDANSCVGMDALQISAEGILDVELGADTLICEGEIVLLQAGSDQDDIQWFLDGAPIGGATNPMFNATESGLYSVIISNGDNCVGGDTISVSTSPTPEIGDLGGNQTLCPGTTLTLSTDATGDIFNWTLNGDVISGATTNTLEVSEIGTYELTVTTADDCSESGNVMILEGENPVVVLGADTTLCAHLSLNLNAGNPGSTYQWSVDGAIIDGATNQLINPQTSGQYSVTVTNVNNCSSTDTINVERLPSPIFNIGPDTSFCLNSSIILDVDVENADTYQWYLNNQTVNGATSPTIEITSPGSYSLNATNTFNCLVGDQITITGLEAPMVELGNDTAVCSNRPFQYILNFTSGTTYQWFLNDILLEDQTTQILIPASTGTYVSLLTNTNGCTATDTAFFERLDAPVFDVGQDTALCLGDTLFLDIEVINGTIFQWYLDNEPISNATTNSYAVTIPGYYSLNVNNENNCLVGDAANVEELEAPLVSLSPDAAICEGMDYTIELDSDANDIQWYFNGMPIAVDPLFELTTDQIGIYTVEGSNGICTAVDSVILSSDAPIVNLGADTTLCPGNTLVFEAGGNGASFEWYLNGELIQAGPSPTLDVQQAGTYEVIAISTNDCEARDTITVSEGEVPVIELGAEQSLCGSGTITLSAGSGEIFEWLRDGMVIDTAQSSTLEVDVEGNYSVTVISEDGCSNSDEVSIIDTSPPNINLGQDTSICNGQSLAITIDCPGCTAIWSDGSSQLSRQLNEAITYSVEVEDLVGCTAQDSISLSFLPEPEGQLTDSLELCPGDLETISPGTFESYLWSTGENTASIDIEAPIPSPGGSFEYWVEISDENNCTSRDTIQVAWVATLNALVDASTNTACEGDTIQLSAGGGLYYEWIAADSVISATDIPNPLAYPVESTTYLVYVSDDCPSNIDSTSITIKIDPAPDGSAGQDTCILVGQEYELNASGGISYRWEREPFVELSALDIPNPIIQPTLSAVYEVAITGENGCVLRDSVQVLVAENPLDFIQKVNIITPNGDGQNDFLIFDGLGKFQRNNLTVFNRWGNIIYQNTNYENDWDGTYKGEPLPAGTYFYVLQILPGDAVIKSALTIVRE